MAVNERATARTYGNWRRPGSAGLGQLGLIGTGVLLVGLLCIVLTTMFAGLFAAAGVGAIVGAALLLLLVRDHHHRNGLQRIGARIGFRGARLRGHPVYRGGPLSPRGLGRFQLPGLAASSELYEGQDAHGRPFALVHLPRTGQVSVVFGAEPDGASLVDSDQQDAWVAHWGQWLARLSGEPGLVAASVTVETAPDSGSRLRREVLTNLDPSAPLAARAMLAEVVDTYPVGSASIQAWVGLTFSTATRSGGRRRSIEEVARDLASRLPALGQGLAAAGAGAARPVSAQELCELVRCAYDPDAAAVIEEARELGEVLDLTWADVGPAAAQANWGSYRHDNAVSVTWSMSQPPRGEVFSSVLSGLLAPHPDVDRKRVSLLYRVLDPGTAARIVEVDKRNALFRATSSQRPSARSLTEVAAAEATAREEATGAGLVNFAMLVTATVADPAGLADARAAVDALSAGARVQLRPVYGSQDSAFAACLPLGLVLSSHLRVPAELREAL
ncbi:MAG: SCO6880 family protein [Actinomycetales bacterium]